MTVQRNPSRNEIESTLVFDVDKYAEYEAFERVAEGIHEWKYRMTEYVYDIEMMDDRTELQVVAKYYDSNELINQSSSETYQIDDGKVIHAGERWDVEQFIEDNFMADPKVSITEEWESMV